MFYFVFFCFDWFFKMAKATYAKNFRFFTSPWSVGLRQISCFLWSNKKRDTSPFYGIFLLIRCISAEK